MRYGLTVIFDGETTMPEIYAIEAPKGVSDEVILRIAKVRFAEVADIIGDDVKVSIDRDYTQEELIEHADWHEATEEELKP